MLKIDQKDQEVVETILVDPIEMMIEVPWIEGGEIDTAVDPMRDIEMQVHPHVAVTEEVPRVVVKVVEVEVTEVLTVESQGFVYFFWESNKGLCVCVVLYVQTGVLRSPSLMEDALHSFL